MENGAHGARDSHDWCKDHSGEHSFGTCVQRQLLCAGHRCQHRGGAVPVSEARPVELTFWLTFKWPNTRVSPSSQRAPNDGVRQSEGAGGAGGTCMFIGGSNRR